MKDTDFGEKGYLNGGFAFTYPARMQATGHVSWPTCAFCIIQYMDFAHWLMLWNHTKGWAVSLM